MCLFTRSLLQLVFCGDIDCPTDKYVVVILDFGDCLLSQSIFHQNANDLAVNSFDSLILHLHHLRIVVKNLLQCRVLSYFCRDFLLQESRLWAFCNLFRRNKVFERFWRQKSGYVFVYVQIVSNFRSQIFEWNHSCRPLLQVLRNHVQGFFADCALTRDDSNFFKICHNAVLQECDQIH